MTTSNASHYAELRAAAAAATRALNRAEAATDMLRGQLTRAEAKLPELTRARDEAHAAMTEAGALLTPTERASGTGFKSKPDTLPASAKRAEMRRRAKARRIEATQARTETGDDPANSEGW